MFLKCDVKPKKPVSLVFYDYAEKCAENTAETKCYVLCHCVHSHSEVTFLLIFTVCVTKIIFLLPMQDENCTS